MSTSTLIQHDQLSVMLGSMFVLGGLALVLHGLLGGPKLKRGLLRSRAGPIHRMEGWRRVVIGLAIAGIGFALLFESKVMLFLALGIGGVELLEASVVISVARRGASSNRQFIRKHNAVPIVPIV